MTLTLSGSDFTSVRRADQTARLTVSQKERLLISGLSTGRLTAIGAGTDPQGTRPVR